MFRPTRRRRRSLQQSKERAYLAAIWRSLNLPWNFSGGPTREIGQMARHTRWAHHCATMRHAVEAMTALIRRVGAGQE